MQFLHFCTGMFACVVRAAIALSLVIAAGCSPAEPAPDQAMKAAAPRAMEAQPISGDSPQGVATEDPQTDALAVVLSYYSAIDRDDYERAYAAWGSKGPAGQTFEEFRSGFENTARVYVQAGSASRVEGAAGSQYVEIPVSVVAFTRDGRQQSLEGTYTLRRSVVEGAPPADRAWHIADATLREGSSGEK